MSMASIQQNIGYDGMLQEVSPNTTSVNSQTLSKKDDTQRRRSQENMSKNKEKRQQKLYNQEQYKGQNLTTYRGKRKTDENIAPSDSFLCSKTKNLALKK